MSIIGLEACMLNPAHIEDTFSDCLATCSTHLGKSNNLRGSEVHPILYSFSANYAPLMVHCLYLYCGYNGQIST